MLFFLKKIKNYLKIDQKLMFFGVFLMGEKKYKYPSFPDEFVENNPIQSHEKIIDYEETKNDRELVNLKVRFVYH